MQRFRNVSSPVQGLALGLAVLAVLLGATGAEAQAFGRIKFVVTNPSGEPIEGANLTITCNELSNFLQEKTTNKKGSAMVAVVDGTKRYQILIEAEGYQSVNRDIKPQLGAMITEEVTLLPPASQATGGGQVAKLTPSQEAFNAGVEAYQAEDYATAKANFNEALSKDKNLHVAHLALAEIYFQERDFNTALTEVETLLKVDPQNTRGLRLLYEVHNELGNKNEAKAALKVLSDLGESGDAGAALYNEGVAAYQVGNLDVAKARFSEALGVDPDLIPAIKALAQIHYKQGSFSEAYEMVSKLIEQEPDNPQYIRMRWESAVQMGDKEKEEAAFQALVEVDPAALAQDFLEKGAALFEQGNTEGAAELFNKILEINPDHPRAHYRLGLCLVASDGDAAKSHFERFIALAPDDPEIATAKEMLSYLQ